MSTEPFAGGSDPDSVGRTVPPYKGSQQSAEVDDQGKTEKEGAKTAGATGPVRDDEMKAADPTDTARGQHASLADEQPADQMPESEISDPGVEPAHISGTRRGEDLREPG